MGRTAALTVPAAELAIIEHRGPHDDVDRSYGALATYGRRHVRTHPAREIVVVAHEGVVGHGAYHDAARGGVQDSTGHSWTGMFSCMLGR
jgi:hypothetical protein